MKSVFITAATTISLGFLTPIARAALIPGVTATTDMGNFSSENILNTVNGVGLPGDTPSLSGNHDTGGQTNAWTSGFLMSIGNITFNLNGTYNLAGFSFWNSNGINGFGIRSVTVQSSTDGTNFSTIAGAPTQFAIGANGFPAAPETFSFSPVTTSFVRFVVLNNYGGFSTSFSEVQFDSFDAPPAATPEPGTVLGLLVIGGGMVATRRLKG